MSECKEIHHHPEFNNSFNPKNKAQVYEVDKLKRYLKTNVATTGEQLKGDSVPLKSFPRGHKDIRCLFILCRDCKKEALEPKCSFCESDEHSMDDAVLFYIGAHDEAYKEGKKKFQEYKSKPKSD